MNDSFDGTIEPPLHDLALAMGASHFGIADMRRAQAVWPDSFEESGPLPTGISIGVSEDDDLLDGLPQTDEPCRTSHYSVKIALALAIADRIRDILVQAGHLAHRLSHPPAKRPTGLYKLVARLAGLGWIGKNRLLITPDRGPRVALATVLTDASLRPTAAKPMEDGCGECTRCIRICPVEAFTTDAFGETDSMKGFDAGRCAVYRGVINPTGWGVCGLCVQICPFGRKSS